MVSFHFRMFNDNEKNRNMLMYLQMILNREDDELVKRIFTAQKSNPCSGDFTELIKKDFQGIKVEYNERKVHI